MMKRIMIIGASSGIGRGVALELAGRGLTVGIAARREDMLEEIAAEASGRVIFRRIDVTAEDAAVQLEALAGDMGGADTVLYAAGTGWGNPTLDPGYEQRAIAVNVKGFTTVCDWAYHYFSRAGSGHLAAITSIGGTKGIGNCAAYSASKRYQWTYLQALRQLAHQDKLPLIITDIRPGFASTDLLKDETRRLPMVMPAQRVVSGVVKALDGRCRVAVIDWRWRLLGWGWRVLPGSLWSRLHMI